LLGYVLVLTKENLRGRQSSQKAMQAMPLNPAVQRAWSDIELSATETVTEMEAPVKIRLRNMPIPTMASRMGPPTILAMSGTFTTWGCLR
jgi:hypothetical protein